MPQSAGKDQIIIANRAGELRRMTLWLWGFAEAEKLPDQLAQDLDLCANEAVSNIINYAYTDSGSHDISLEITRVPAGVRLVIRDDGKPFNPLELPERVMPTNLDDAVIGGLGVHLIRRLTTHCHYERVGAANVLSMEAGVAAAGANV
jgi:serine/threonine-protein kinase RsbW